MDQAKPRADGLLWKKILRGPRQPEPCSGPTRLGWAPTVAGFGAAWRAVQMGPNWLERDPGSLPICEDGEIRLAMSDYSRAESDSVI